MKVEQVFNGYLIEENWGGTKRSVFRTLGEVFSYMIEVFEPLTPKRENNDAK